MLINKNDIKIEACLYLVALHIGTIFWVFNIDFNIWSLSIFIISSYCIAISLYKYLMNHV